MARRPPGERSSLASPRAAGADDWMQRAEAELQLAKQLDSTGNEPWFVFFHAGQAVEFALKAIFMKINGYSEWPSQNSGAGWHSVEQLAKITGVEKELSRLIESQPYFVTYWLVVKDWDHKARYPNMYVSRSASKQLLRAVIHHKDGVMQWLRNRYQTS